jgi:hydroxymethylglutaryl-CoA reductase
VSDSRIPGLFRLSVAERIDELVRLGWLGKSDAVILHAGRHVLLPKDGDRIIENVIATFGLPFAVAPNFQVNGRDYIVPLVVEEPSVVAALSNAARLARAGGGFEATCDESLLIGQVHVTGISDVEAAKSAIAKDKTRLLTLANEVHPGLLARGGGVRDIEVRELRLADGEQFLAVHILVDTCDAMGANLVNTICEAIAPEIANSCNGIVAISILSNLADRSLFSAAVRVPLAELASTDEEAIIARDAIVRADQIAHADPYRAATHNKGIMNGIDSLAIATGNDWRAIEAGVHAFAAQDGVYRPLTRWSVDASGDLVGEIRLPLKVGIVGGTLDANPAARIGLGICGVESAAELAQLMSAVGLAQNFAAIRALATTGIQKGHMRLHARSIVAAAGVPQHWFDEIVNELVAGGEIKSWKTRELLVNRESADAESAQGAASAAGKVILLGEHAVVYGKHALALPIRNAVSARVSLGNPQSTLTIPEWGLWQELDPDAESRCDLGTAIALIARELDVSPNGIGVQVHSDLPRAMGLGSSAAIAVAIIRAFDMAFKLGIDDDRVNAIAFECEKLAHGTPSGLDNTVATFERPLLFRRESELELSPIELIEEPPIVVACSNSAGLTVEQVAGVRSRFAKNKRPYEAIFSEMDEISRCGAEALITADYASLGSLMNICHGLLNAIEVSTPELESMVSIARAAGAAGAKLTGAGGGGSIVAVCPGMQDSVAAALQAAGFQTMLLDRKIGGKDD